MTTVTISGPGTVTDTDLVNAYGSRDIAFGDTLVFAPAATTTLEMDAINLVIHGTLQMHPASNSVVHTLRFINVNEQAFVGAPTPTYLGPNMGSMTAVATDIGLWVLDHGILDAIGTPRAGWNRTGDDSTWLSTDDMRTVPFNIGDYTTFVTHTKGGTLQTVAPGNGQSYTQECFNLTRNVCFEGTVGHRAHVLIMTPGITQTIKYARFENMGPRKNLPNGETDVFRGRWAGIHFHHLGTTNSLAEGIVVTNSTGHAYVSHDSHNTTFRDCIAFHTVDEAFWWDQEFVPNGNHTPPISNSDYSVAADQVSHFVTYDHCMAAYTYTLPGESSASIAGFLLQPGANAFANGGNTITDCVAVGNQGTSSAAGFDWPEHSSGEWINSDLVTHNNAGRGAYIWQNNAEKNEIIGMIAYRNGLGGITNGAYTNDYHYFNCVSFQNGGSGDLSTDLIAAAGANAAIAPGYAQYLEGNWFGDTGIVHHVATTPGAKCIWKQNHLGSIRIQENRGPGSTFKHGEFDFIENDLQEPEDFCNQVHPHAGNHTWLYAYNASTSGDSGQSIFRVQRSDHTAYRLQQVGASFTDFTAVTVPTIWFYVTTNTLPPATPGVAYSQILSTIWGAANYLPFTWRLKDGSGPLPAGLTLVTHIDNVSGKLSGTPTVAGSYPITVEILNGHAQTSISKDYTLVVGTSTALVITTTSLPGGFVGQTYSQTLASTGGSGTGKVWTLVSGTMPAGLGLSAAGVISGTPTTVQSTSFTVRVTDSGSNTDTQLLAVQITTLNPTITSASPLPTAAVGVPYTQNLVATGGTPPYTFSLVSGTMPTGLSFTDADTISGTPTTPVVASLGIRCTDSLAHTNDKTLSLTVANGVSFYSSTPPPGAVGVDYSFTFVAQNGVPPYTFSSANVGLPIPPGLTLGSDGVLAGTPTFSSTYPFVIRVDDSGGTSAQADVSLFIGVRQLKVRRALSMRGSASYVSVG